MGPQPKCLLCLARRAQLPRIPRPRWIPLYLQTMNCYPAYYPPTTCLPPLPRATYHHLRYPTTAHLSGASKAPALCLPCRRTSTCPSRIAAMPPAYVTHYTLLSGAHSPLAHICCCAFHYRFSIHACAMVLRRDSAPTAPPRCGRRAATTAAAVTAQRITAFLSRLARYARAAPACGKCLRTTS